MMRMEPNVVLKYFPPLDEFVRLRVFSQADIEEMLRFAKAPSKRQYQQLVVNACVVHYNESVLPHLAQISYDKRASFEDGLFALCVEVNPSLDIGAVTLTPGGEPRPEIHLLSGPSVAAQAEPALPVRDLEEVLSRRIIGQEEAVHTVARAVKKAAVGLRDERRPIGTFFFVGQTGVGKTELAKALAEALWHDLGHLIRVDCSEYSQPHEYAKLIGAPPGYIGFKEGGVLTEAMRQRRAGVVLFDEIEKADPKVHDLLLQLLDEGTLTDSKGTAVPFGDAVVIMTSNVGVDEVDSFRNRAGFDSAKRQAPTRDELFREVVAGLKRGFRPEFINRVDDIVLFQPLSFDHCVRIVEILLDEVRRHAVRRRLGLTFTPPVKRFLAERGFSPEFGARELRRTVVEMVEEPLSELLVDGKIPEGAQVHVTVKGNRLAFHAN